MKEMEIGKAFTLMESGPVVLVTTNDRNKNNIMTISWTMVVDFTPIFAMTTGSWNYSFFPGPPGSALYAGRRHP